MKTPRFSVIIPTLNEEKFLPKLLASLAQQSLKDFEVIVVDGKSKDKTVPVAESFKKKFTLKIIGCERASPPMQRNLGAAHARGQWLVFVDADSVLLPYFFDRIDAFIPAQTPSLFTTWFRPDSEVASDALVTLLGNMVLEASIYFHRPFSPGPLTIVRREVFERVGGYNEETLWGEDFEFTKRVSEAGIAFTILRESICVYSLRRFRKNKLQVIQAWTKGIFSVLLTKTTPKYMPGYLMGGHLYGKTRKSKSRLARYEKKLKKLMKELFQ